MALPVHDVSESNVEILYRGSQASRGILIGRSECEEVVAVDASQCVMGQQLEFLGMSSKIGALLLAGFSSMAQGLQARLCGFDGALYSCNKRW
jgi:hypothetical protein